MVTPPSSRSDSGPALLAGALIVAATVVAYHNSLSGPFVFDDQLSIVDNPTIRQLWPPWAALTPPRGQGLTVEGRPILNFSFALNYALGDTAVAGYHAVNLLIHLSAALLLFAVVRGALLALRLPLDPRGGFASPTTLATAVALLWAVHPLQTESVTYVVQRTESLMSFFYLATLYTFQRATATPSPRSWFALAVAVCALGMATKEVMVSAPLIVLLYDRTFVSGSFALAWRRHRVCHLGLAATWLVLAVLVIGAGNRGGTIGGTAGVTPWQYALCQSRALIHYLQLVVWPHPLIFDYGADFVPLATAAPFALAILGLLAITIYALRRRPALGFVGAWFFLILAPTSSFVGGTRQMLAEHRIYLALAAPVVLIVLALHRLLGRRAWLALAPLALALIAVTILRNHDYRTALALYTNTAIHRPDNPHARYNLAKLLAESGQPAAALPHYEATLRLQPDYFVAHYNLANALAELGRPAEAAAHYEAALTLKPDYVRAHYNLGNALVALDRKPAAAEHYRAALRADPAFNEARDNLGSVLLDLGQLPEAEAQFREALRRDPGLAPAHCNLGTVCLLQGRLDEARAHYEQALRFEPQLAPARAGLERVRAAAAGRLSPDRR